MLVKEHSILWTWTTVKVIHSVQIHLLVILCNDSYFLCGQDMGLFCEERGARTPRPASESRDRRTPPSDSPAAARNVQYHTLSDNEQQV